MKNLLKFKCEEEYDEDICACRDDLRDSLLNFHKTLMLHCDMPTLQQPDEPAEAEPVEESPGTIRDRLKSLIWKVKKEEEVKEKPSDEEPKTGNTIFLLLFFHIYQHLALCCTELNLININII